MIHPLQEHDRVPGRIIAAAGVATIVAVVIGSLVVLNMITCRSREVAALDRDVSGIRTQPFSVSAAGIAEHRREELELGAYGWVDRAHGIVHIPIDRAIDLYVEANR